ncbi:MAG: hypothetical protein KBD78_01970 [Oligoflexales bacterium]|nr:hypothetical protein [Oligoflexales bacterium]
MLLKKLAVTAFFCVSMSGVLFASEVDRKIETKIETAVINLASPLDNKQLSSFELLVASGNVQGISAVSNAGPTARGAQLSTIAQLSNIIANIGDQTAQLSTIPNAIGIGGAQLSTIAQLSNIIANIGDQTVSQLTNVPAVALGGAQLTNIPSSSGIGGAQLTNIPATFN